MLGTADALLISSVFTIGILGTLINISLFILILHRKALRDKEYIAFILHRTAADLALSLQMLILQPFGIALSNNTWMWCQISGSGFLWLSLGILILESSLAINRYISICRSDLYGKIFNKRNNIIIFLLSWLLSFALTLPNIILGTIGRSPGLVCVVLLNYKTLPVVLGTAYPVVLFSVGCVGYSYVKIYRFLKQHEGQVSIQATVLKENKSLLRFIGFTAMLPILSEIPGGLTAFLRMLDESLVTDVALFAGVLPYMCLTIINPIATCCLMRPLRKEVLNSLKRIFKTGNITPVVPFVETTGRGWTRT